MDAKTSITKRLPSRHVTEGGAGAAPLYLYAMGLTTSRSTSVRGGGVVLDEAALVTSRGCVRPGGQEGSRSAGGTAREILHHHSDDA